MNQHPQFYQQQQIPSISIRKWRRFTTNRRAVSALAIFLLIALFAIFAPFIAPYDPTHQFNQYLLPPSWSEDGSLNYLLGTDELGRDIFSRLVHGANLSLKLALSVVIIASSVGVLLGFISIIANQWIAHILLRFMDLILALPSLLLAIVIVALIGPGLPNAIYAVALVLIPQFVIVTRNAILNEINKDYVTAMILDGSGKYRLYAKTIFPNITSPLIIQFVSGFSIAILEVSTLGFLGLGAQAPHPEWGTILSESHTNIVNAPWTVTLPGLAIFFTLLSVNLIGDGLRDSLELED